MKVLLINSVCGYGSTGRICTDISSVLKKAGDDALICYGRGNAPAKSDAYKIGNELDVRLHGLVSRLNDRHGLYSKSATKRLVEKIKDYDPDVINLHNIHGYYLNYEILFRFLADFGRPVVWTLHDCWSFTGHCAHFYDNGCEEWKSGCKKCRFKFSYPKTVGFSSSAENFELKKKLFTSVDKMTLVSPSKWLAELAKQSFLGKFDIRVINNGINLEAFKPVQSDFREKYGLENKKVIIGVSNAWGRLKGLDTFEKLAVELPESYKIVLVGIAPDTADKITDKIIKIGRTASTKELAKLYTAADVFLNPTLQDNFPTVNIEALACGTPVITYNSGGSAEALSDETGVAVERGNYSELKKKILQLDDLGFDSSECVRSAQDYDQNIKFTEYRNLYDSLS